MGTNPGQYGRIEGGERACIDIHRPSDGRRRHKACGAAELFALPTSIVSGRVRTVVPDDPREFRGKESRELSPLKGHRTTTGCDDIHQSSFARGSRHKLGSYSGGVLGVGTM